MARFGDGKEEAVGGPGGHRRHGHIGQPKADGQADIHQKNGQDHAIAGAIGGHGRGGERHVVHQAGHQRHQKDIGRQTVEEGEKEGGHQQPQQIPQDPIIDAGRALLCVGHQHQKDGHGVPVGKGPLGEIHEGEREAEHHRQPNGEPALKAVELEKTVQSFPFLRQQGPVGHGLVHGGVRHLLQGINQKGERLCHGLRSGGGGKGAGVLKKLEPAEELLAVRRVQLGLQSGKQTAQLAKVGGVLGSQRLSGGEKVGEAIGHSLEEKEKQVIDFSISCGQEPGIPGGVDHVAHMGAEGGQCLG